MGCYEILARAAQNGEVIDVLTLVACPEDAAGGRMLLLHQDGRQDGVLWRQDFTEKAVAYIREQSWQGPKLLRLEHDAGGCGQIFWDRLLPARKAIIFGAGHISRALAQMLSLLDFELIVVDDRPEFATAAWFPAGTEIMCQDFAKATLQLAERIDAQTAVVLATRGHQHDLLCLRLLAGTAPAYMGMLGSRRRVAALFRQLADEGVPEAWLARIYAPIGLDLGAQTPGEIALSIAAEILGVLQKKSAQSLRLAQEVWHGRNAAEKNL